MDPFLDFLLYSAIISASLILLYLFHKPKSAKLPPGNRGWPIFGETFKFKTYGSNGHPEKFIHERMKAFSKDVFRTSLFTENVAVFCGAQGNKFLFSGENNYVSSWYPSSVTKVLNFPELESSEKWRGFILEFIKPEALQHYIQAMDSVARQHVEAVWLPCKEVKAFKSAAKLSFAWASHLYIGIEDTNNQVTTELEESYDSISAGLISVPVNFPGTAYNKAIKGGKRIRADLMDIVRRRKKEILEGKNMTANDFLSRMLLLKDERGGVMKETEIVNSIVGFIFTSHDSITTSITVVMYYLAEFPDIYDQVLKEQMEIAKSKGPNELLTWKDIQKMKYSWMVVCESLRLLSPAHGAFRDAIVDFTYSGYTIPKGWKTYWTVHSTHKNPEYFPDPERFDPSRFEGKGPAPFTFVPFGGGPRMCRGKEFAKLQILVFIYNAVTRFRWKKAIPDEKITYNPSPTPVNGLPVHVKPHN